MDQMFDTIGRGPWCGEELRMVDERAKKRTSGEGPMVDFNKYRNSKEGA